MTNAISANGLALIQEHEGFQAEPKQLPTGGWVVGYSHVRVTEPGDAINENEAVDLLALDLAPTEQLVNALVTKPLTQSQFDALVSFGFSVGPEAFERSQVLRRTNAGEYVAAACAMDAWRKSEINGELSVIDALVRRRAAEKALFLKEVRTGATPSVFVRAQLDHAAAILGAPVAYAAAPEVGSIPRPQPKSEPAQRLTEILKSEPATETLLLTQVVANDTEADEGEIVTAHAKPVARMDFQPRIAPRRSKQAQPDKKRWFSLPRKPHAPKGADLRLHKERLRTGFKLPIENLGLAALMFFGLGLLAIAASLLVAGTGDVAELAGAGALGAPGLAAALMAAYGLRRTPRPKPAPVDV